MSVKLDLGSYDKPALWDNHNFNMEAIFLGCRQKYLDELIFKSFFKRIASLKKEFGLSEIA